LPAGVPKQNRLVFAEIAGLPENVVQTLRALQRT
jgi:hypothetical protein